MDARCGLKTHDDDTGMGDTWEDGSAKGATRPMRALPRAEARLAGTLRAVDWRVAACYVLATVVWWLCTSRMGVPVTLPVLVPLPGSRSMLAVPALVVAVACTAVAVLSGARGTRPRHALVVPLTLALPGGLAVITNELALHGVAGPGQYLWEMALMSVVALVMGLCLDEVDLQDPRQVAAELALAALLALTLLQLFCPGDWQDHGLRGYVDEGGEASLAERAGRLEDGWADMDLEARSQASADYLAKACDTLGADPLAALVVIPGPMRSPRFYEDVYPHRCPIASMSDLLSPSPGAMLRELDELAEQSALYDRGEDALWVLSPDADDPTVAAWARTEGVRYGEALGGTVAGNEETYCEMAESLLSYVRREGEGDADVQA